MQLQPRCVERVDIGNAYLNDTAGAEITTYLSKSSGIKTITKPILDGKMRYYSLLSDGSSSAKTMAEKEVFLLKSATQGVPKFMLLGLEEPTESNAVGLKQALETAMSKVEISDQQAKEVGICTDGAAVNVALHRLFKADIGPHYVLTLCPNDKVELAVKDAFKDSPLNEANEAN